MRQRPMAILLGLALALVGCHRSEADAASHRISPISSEKVPPTRESNPKVAPLPARSGHVDNSCAPWDGAAVVITIDDRSECGAPTGPSIVISVWKALPLSAGLTLTIADGTQDGSVARCSAPGKCEIGRRVELTIDTYEEGRRITGSYTITFRDGATQSSAFDAKWCATKAMCG